MTADEATPSRRSYRSPRREQQAAQTRGEVVAAASRLFGDRGWAATGMRDVAGAAGVAVETVYANFRSKAELLLACIDVAIVGDTALVALNERAEFAALARGSRTRRAAAAAELMTAIHQRTARLNLAFRDGAAADPGLAALWRERELRRRINVEQGTSLVAGRAVTEQEVDGLWALLGVEVYRLLTDVRGWTASEYETWLADVLTRLTRDGGK